MPSRKGTVEDGMVVGERGRMTDSDLPEEIRAAIDRYIADQPDPKPSVREAVRILVADALIGAGYMPPPDRRGSERYPGARR